MIDILSCFQHVILICSLRNLFYVSGVIAVLIDPIAPRITPSLLKLQEN